MHEVHVLVLEEQVAQPVAQGKHVEVAVSLKNPSEHVVQLRPSLEQAMQLGRAHALQVAPKG